MIIQTAKTHEGMPVFEAASARSFALTFTPALLDGVQIGFMRDACGFGKYPSVSLERTYSGYRMASGIRFTGD